MSTHSLPWLPDCNRFLSVPAQALVLLQADDAVGEQSCKMSVPISHQEDASKSREASAAICKSRWQCPLPCWCPLPSAAASKGIGGVHRRHRSGTRQVLPASRLAAGPWQVSVLETAEWERGGFEGPSVKRRACLLRTPRNPPTGKASEGLFLRKTASCANRRAAGWLRKNRQALQVGGGSPPECWLLRCE